MNSIEDIKVAITGLPEPQYIELRKWFSDSDWKLWDEQIEKDSQSGKLDFLIEEARNEMKAGCLKPL